MASAAVEEALRYEPAFQFVARVATADLDIGGQALGRMEAQIAFSTLLRRLCDLRLANDTPGGGQLSACARWRPCR